MKLESISVLELTDVSGGLRFGGTTYVWDGPRISQSSFGGVDRGEPSDRIVQAVGVGVASGAVIGTATGAVLGGGGGAIIGFPVGVAVGGAAGMAYGAGREIYRYFKGK